MSNRITLTTSRRLLVVLGVALLALPAAAAATTSALLTPSFSDVQPGDPFFEEIEWGAHHGIVEGYGDGTFRPTDPASRQAVIAFLARTNAGIEVVEHVVPPEVPLASDSAIVAVASCPPGKRAIAGGGRVAPSASGFDQHYGAFRLLASEPTEDGSGWEVAWASSSGIPVAHGGYRLHATCIPDAPVG